MTKDVVVSAAIALSVVATEQGKLIVMLERIYISIVIFPKRFVACSEQYILIANHLIKACMIVLHQRLYSQSTT